MTVVIGATITPANKIPAMSRLALLLCSIALLAGCASTPEQRISRQPADFNQLTPAQQQKVRAGQVDVGFTESMVWLALGEPARKLERVAPEGTVQVWVYTRNAPRFSFGIGVGGGGGHTAVGTGVGVSTGGSDPEEVMRVEFSAGRVVRIETVKR